MRLKEIATQLGFLDQIRNLQFLAVGPFREIRIAEFNENLQPFDKKTMVIIQKKWQEHLKEHPKDFPGPLASMRYFEIRKGTLYLYLQKSRFDFFIATRTKEPRILNLKQRPLDRYFSLPIGFGAVTVTSDSYIVCGLRGKKKVSLGGGKLTTLPGGYFNPESHVIYPEYNKGKPEPSLLAMIITELREELGIHWFKEIDILGIVQDSLIAQHPNVVIRLKLNSTKDEIKERAKDIGKEVDRLFFPEDTVGAIKNFGKDFTWTPHDIGKLILHFALP